MRGVDALGSSLLLEMHGALYQDFEGNLGG